jgi:hypothetical protein
MFGPMREIGEGPFKKGEHVWVVGDDGSQRPGEYVGEAETAAWFGGPPKAIVVFPEAHTGEMVDLDRVIPRDS